MKVLVLLKDLVLGSQIRAACESKSFTYLAGRSNEKFKQSVITEIPDKVIIDLNIEGADPFLAIEAAKEVLGSEHIICFYSHVNVELAEKAEEFGVKPEQIYRRSKFFSDISNIV